MRAGTERMRELGLIPSDLARKLGISEKYLRHILRGNTRHVNLRTATRVAKALGWNDPTELLKIKRRGESGSVEVKTSERGRIVGSPPSKINAGDILP